MLSIPGSSATYAFGIDPEAQLALAHMAGTMTGSDMQVVVETVRSDPRWRPHFDAIWDCRAVVSHVVRPSEVGPIVHEMLERDSTEDEPMGRDIMIEHGGLVDVAISQLIAVLCRRAGKEVRVVSTMDAALERLDRTALPEDLKAVAEAE